MGIIFVGTSIKFSFLCPWTTKTLMSDMEMIMRMISEVVGHGVTQD